MIKFDLRGLMLFVLAAAVIFAVSLRVDMIAASIEPLVDRQPTSPPPSAFDGWPREQADGQRGYQAISAKPDQVSLADAGDQGSVYSAGAWWPQHGDGRASFGFLKRSPASAGVSAESTVAAESEGVAESNAVLESNAVSRPPDNELWSLGRFHLALYDQGVLVFCEPVDDPAVRRLFDRDASAWDAPDHEEADRLWRRFTATDL